MRARHITTGITLLVLLGILGVGLALGSKAFFAPVPGSDDDASSAHRGCDQRQVRKGERITSRQVQVSVFNAGSRAGLADETMAALTKRGFRKGAVANAPDDATVARVQVWTTKRNDASARLVANQFGRATKVRLKDSSLGPGVDVVVGDDFDRLTKAARVVVAKRSVAVCETPAAKRG